MKLFYNFASVGFSNTYLLGPERCSDAILIDPGEFNVELLDLVEKNGYYIKHVLITHEQDHHTNGLRTLGKIYDSQIYAARSYVSDIPTTQVQDGKILEISETSVKIIEILGHSNDSLIFQIENMIFTGDSLSAGRIGSTYNPYSKALLLDNLKNKILSLEGNALIFPAHGPPTTLEIERTLTSEIVSPSLVDL